MKNKYYLLSFLTALALVGCSSEDNVANTSGELGDGDDRYLTVNIVNNDSGTRTRAAGDQTKTDSDGTYEEGLADENAVGNVRFYFFNDNGEAVNVKIDGTKAVNYADCSGKSDETGMPNIEERLSATVVLETYQGSPLPTKMVAVLNAKGTELGGNSLDESLSLSELQAILAADSSKYKTDHGFVMSSSVYLNSSNAVACEATIDPDVNLKKKQSEAQLNAVKIYVERTAAKVRVKLGDDLENPSKAKVADGGESTTEGSSSSTTTDYWQYYDEDGVAHDIYVKFVGWDITNISEQSYLFKQISADWATTITTENWDGKWNYPENTSDDSQISYRCFWAMNPTDNTLTNEGIQWTTSKSTWKDFYTDTKTAAVAYCLENAAKDTDGKKPNYDPNTALSNRTQVVLKAELQDENGATLDLAQWQGTIYLRSKVESMMKEQAALVLYTCNGTKYENATSDVSYKFVPGEKTDSLADGTKIANRLTQNSRRYMTYIQFDGTETEAQSLYYYDTAKSSWHQCTSVADVNSCLSKIAPAKMWNSGRTYFYTDIKHLGKELEEYNPYGEYGIVRNHIYDVTINSFTGLGTPATIDSDGTEIDIIPQKTLEEDWYLYSAINILSWRVVSNSADLEW